MKEERTSHEVDWCEMGDVGLVAEPWLAIAES